MENFLDEISIYSTAHPQESRYAYMKLITKLNWFKVLNIKIWTKDKKIVFISDLEEYFMSKDLFDISESVWWYLSSCDTEVTKVL